MVVSKTKILIVEGNQHPRQDIQNKLKSLGYMIPAVAADGKDAIEKTKKIHPDLVLVDIEIQGETNGVEAANYIRNELFIRYIRG